MGRPGYDRYKTRIRSLRINQINTSEERERNRRISQMIFFDRYPRCPAENCNKEVVVPNGTLDQEFLTALNKNPDLRRQLCPDYTIHR